MPTTVAPGQSATFEDQYFVGPKLQEQLEATSPRLRLTVDYGWLTVISQPLFWLLSQIHDLVGNWGWAIILMTVLIKLVFYKLSETSGKSMAKMRKLQPRLKSLQERYADDRQKLSQAMMELYKKEKVNPAAGCLPILVQMPVFLALYWVLLESVEMRQAPFALWIQDLSSRDPYFILPLLMGITMWFQQKLNPAPPDPMQAKIMQLLPVIFTVFFAFFPAGLVLYWFVNNLLAILQQWRINKVVEAGGA
jgi:YidC/Oxa1 family membrane protein insertase